MPRGLARKQQRIRSEQQSPAVHLIPDRDTNSSSSIILRRWLAWVTYPVGPVSLVVAARFEPNRPPNVRRELYNRTYPSVLARYRHLVF